MISCVELYATVYKVLALYLTITDTLYPYLAYLPVLTGSGPLFRSLYTMYVHKLRTNANPNIAPANISRFLLSFLQKLLRLGALCTVGCLLKVLHATLIIMIQINLGI